MMNCPISWKTGPFVRRPTEFGPIFPFFWKSLFFGQRKRGDIFPTFRKGEFLFRLGGEDSRDFCYIFQFSGRDVF